MTSATIAAVCTASAAFADTLFAAWGPCPKDCCLADLDIDGDVGITDFLLLLGNWG